MNPINSCGECSYIQRFRATHPDYMNSIIRPLSAKWGIIECSYKQRKNGKETVYHVPAVINLLNGDLYPKSQTGKIQRECFKVTIMRPLITPVLMFMKILKLFQNIVLMVGKTFFPLGPTSRKNDLQKCMRPLADLVRLPLYGVVLTLISLAGIILSPFHSIGAYSIQELYGKVEQSLNWGKKQTFFTLAPSFQSVFNIDSTKKLPTFGNVTPHNYLHSFSGYFSVRFPENESLVFPRELNKNEINEKTTKLKWTQQDLNQFTDPSRKVTIFASPDNSRPSADELLDKHLINFAIHVTVLKWV